MRADNTRKIELVLFSRLDSNRMKNGKYSLRTLLSLYLVGTIESRMIHRGPRYVPFLASPQNGGLFGVVNVLPKFSRLSKDSLERLRAGSRNDDDDHDDEADDDEKDEASAASKAEKEEAPVDQPSKESLSKEVETRLSMPITVVVRAKLGRRADTIFDQKLEITLQRRRSIAQVKENLRRSLPGKPPVSLMQIVHEGRVVNDSVLLDDLVDEEEEDEEEKSEGEAKGTLHLLLDMVPPVDGKFTQTWSEQLQDLTTAELLRLYAINEAALQETTLSLFDRKGDFPLERIPSDAEEVQDASSPQFTTQILPRLDERADKIESQLREMLNPQQDQKISAILQETRPPSAVQAVSEIRGERIRDAIPSRGVKTSLRRKIQHTFNVQSWPDTIRYICLFFFFGMFGGRTPMSRLILLLGAPSVLVLQARPVKLLWKQVLYTLLIDPPGILLSLLPAPQQTLFHLDKRNEMVILYGPYTTETKDYVKKKNKKSGNRLRDADRTYADSVQMETEQEEEFLDPDEEEFFDATENKEKDIEESEGTGEDGDDDDDDDE